MFYIARNINPKIEFILMQVLESWLIIPLFPVGILLGWGEGQMLICCVNLFIYFRLYKVPDGKL